MTCGISGVEACIRVEVECARKRARTVLDGARISARLCTSTFVFPLKAKVKLKASPSSLVVTLPTRFTKAPIVTAISSSQINLYGN